MAGTTSTGKIGKNWCGTFNYDGSAEGKEAVLRWWEAVTEKAHYAIGGWEVAPTTGQKHLQFYIQFESNQRLGGLKRIRDGSTVHWELARGDERDNVEYCSKGGDTIEHGDEPRVTNAGKREQKRWEDALDAIKNGRLDDVPAQIMICQAKNVLYLQEKYKQRAQDLPFDGEKHIWLWGPSGSGKSRGARSICEEAGELFYDKMVNKWWDLYESEKYVIIDDLEKESAVMLVQHLKRWLDIYPFNGEVKGAVLRGIRPERIIITSNYHPEEIFGARPKEWLEPIMRRLDIRWIGQGAPPIITPGQVSTFEPGPQATTPQQPATVVAPTPDTLPPNFFENETRCETPAPIKRHRRIVVTVPESEDEEEEDEEDEVIEVD